MRKNFSLIECMVVIAIIGVISAMACTFTGCDEVKPSADQELAKQTAESMREANAQIGMPAIKNFQERKLAKMIFELRDQENLICHAYLVSLNGTIGQYLGKCIGFGLPYSVQYTNPAKAVNLAGAIGYSSMNRFQMGTMPQPDPNGLFMPQGLSATWLMLIDPSTGKARPVYIEPQIIVSPFPLHK